MIEVENRNQARPLLFQTLRMDIQKSSRATMPLSAAHGHRQSLHPRFHQDPRLFPVCGERTWLGLFLAWYISLLDDTRYGRVGTEQWRGLGCVKWLRERRHAWYDCTTRTGGDTAPSSTGGTLWDGQEIILAVIYLLSVRILFLFTDAFWVSVGITREQAIVRGD